MTSNQLLNTHIAQKMKFSMKYFFSKCDQIRGLLRIWSHLLKKSLMKNFIFCATTFFTFITFNNFFKPESRSFMHFMELLNINQRVSVTPEHLIFTFNSFKKYSLQDKDLKWTGRIIKVLLSR